MRRGHVLGRPGLELLGSGLLRPGLLRSGLLRSGLLRSGLLALALALSGGAAATGIVGCGGAAPAADDPAGIATAGGEDGAAPGAGAPAGSGAGADAEAPAAPPAAATPAPRDADESDPEGLPKISTDERDALEGECKKFTDAVAKAIGRKKPKPGETRADQVLAALAKPPTIKGVDGQKCADLMKRDVIIYAARQAESQAKNNLKLIAVNIGVAYEKDKKLCPSAGPTPASLEGLANGAVETTPNDWMAPGWACTRFGPSSAPTRWQYELKTDRGAGTWQVIARGYPVAGGPPAELFLQGVIDAGGVTPPGAIKRR